MRWQIWHPWEFRICTNTDPKSETWASSLALSHSFIKSYWFRPILSPESVYSVFPMPPPSCSPVISYLVHWHSHLLPAPSLPLHVITIRCQKQKCILLEESKLPKCGFKCLFALLPCLVSCLICYLPTPFLWLYVPFMDGLLAVP